MRAFSTFDFLKASKAAAFFGVAVFAVSSPAVADPVNCQQTPPYVSAFVATLDCDGIGDDDPLCVLESAALDCCDDGSSPTQERECLCGVVQTEGATFGTYDFTEECSQFP